MIVAADRLHRYGIDPLEPRDLLIERTDSRITVRDSSPIAKLTFWRRSFEAARHEPDRQARLGRLRLLAAMAQSDADECDDPPIRLEFDVLLLDLRREIRVLGWPPPFGEPEVSDPDDPDFW